MSSFINIHKVIQNGNILFIITTCRSRNIQIIPATLKKQSKQDKSQGKDLLQYEYLQLIIT